MHRLVSVWFAAVSMFLMALPATPQNQNLSNGVIFDGEPYLAVDPTNSQHIVVAWMGYVFSNQIMIKTRVSVDGGNTWTNTQNTPHAAPSYGSADPSLAFDSNGNVYLSYVDYDATIDSGAVYLRKSVDGGLTWGSEVEVMNMHDDPNKKAIDRPWMVIDRSGGTYDGYIYITTMNPNPATFGVTPPPYNPYLNISVDGGSTFGPFRYVDTAGWYAGSSIPQPMPTPAMASDGTFHAVYPSYESSQNLLPQYILASSVDGGNVLSHQTVFATTQVTGSSDAKSGYLLRSDPSDPNHLAFIYLGPDNGDLDIFMRETFDGGATWSSQIRINDDPVGNNRMQDLLWADFDNDGDLVVSWRDRRNGTDSTYATSSEIWAAVRYKDSTGFSPNFQVSDQLVAYDTILAESGNDFMCISLGNDTISAVWGDVRTSRLNIFFQRMTMDGVTLSLEKLASEAMTSTNVFPNPSTGIFTVTGEQLQRVDVYDLNGRQVYSERFSPTDLRSIELNSLNAGAYLLKVRSIWGVEVMRVVIK